MIGNGVWFAETALSGAATLSHRHHARIADPSAVLPRIITVALLALSVVLAGCGSGRTPASTAGGVASPAGQTPTATSGNVAPAPLVMIIRHGERPDWTHPGVDASGNPDDASLTTIGWNRARGLVNVLDPAHGSPRPGVGRPKAIYAAGANSSGEGRRTRETVTPLADALGIPVNTSFGKGDEKALVEQVIGQPGPTLICWQHGEIPTIAADFPSVTPTPPAEWPADRFDVIWLLTKTTDGWHFDQMPELALPQDQNRMI
jgi:broad specificity phosphatase PhoE